MSRFVLLAVAVSFAVVAVSASPKVGIDWCTSTTYCPDGYSCCADKIHCCPSGYTCGTDYCYRSGVLAGEEKRVEFLKPERPVQD